MLLLIPHAFFPENLVFYMNLKKCHRSIRGKVTPFFSKIPTLFRIIRKRHSKDKELNLKKLKKKENDCILTKTPVSNIKVM